MSVDGHVPVDDIRKLLAEKPAIAGITLPRHADGLPSRFTPSTGMGRRRPSLPSNDDARAAFALVAVMLAVVLPVQAAEAPQNFVLYGAPQPLPDIRFFDAAGKQLSLGDFHGKVVLLNIWATWCAPCRQEIPTLDWLQAKLGGADFTVVPLSIDRKGMSAVDGFYREIGVRHLAIYLDARQAASRLNATGVPSTLLIDREGRELGRLVGPAEWDSPDMIAFLRGVVARKPGP
jgi:thiol-disulfide isomerase/thioredoxin